MPWRALQKYGVTGTFTISRRLYPIWNYISLHTNHTDGYQQSRARDVLKVKRLMIPRQSVSHTIKE